MKIDEIEKLVRLFETSALAKMEVAESDLTIKLEKNTVTMPTEFISAQTVDVSAPEKEVEIAEDKTDGHWITSPLVGTYYQSNVENGDALVNVGDMVKKGDLLCIIEAMKMMNEIRCDVDGIVTSIQVENGQMVEYDEPLICIGGAND